MLKINLIVMMKKRKVILYKNIELGQDKEFKSVQPNSV